MFRVVFKERKEPVVCITVNTTIYIHIKITFVSNHFSYYLFSFVLKLLLKLVVFIFFE